MSLSMYEISVPVFQRMLTNLTGILEKAEAHATARKIEPEVLINARLAPDMFPLKRQIQIASDMARGAVCRLTGTEIPKWEDKEASFGDLKARLKKTVDFLAGFKAAQLDGSEARDINLTIAQKPVTLKGQVYLMTHAYPHFFFHVATAHDILRHNGVEIGKRDYIGTF
jgi:uncharacterized protein